MVRKDRGTITFHAKAISWSMRSRGKVPRIQKITAITAYTLTKNQMITQLPSRNGPDHPPRNSSTVSAAMAKVLMYSARKNTDQCAPLYSTKGPPTISDSAK